MNKFLSFIADRIYTFLLNSFFVVILHKKNELRKKRVFLSGRPVGIDPTS